MDRNETAKQAPTVDAARSRQRKKAVTRALLRGLVGSLLFIVGCILVVGVSLVLVQATGVDMVVIHDWLLKVKRFAFALQFGLIGALWLWWREIVGWVIAKGWMPESARAPLIARRNRWVAILSAMQILMVIASSNAR